MFNPATCLVNFFETKLTLMMIDVFQTMPNLKKIWSTLNIWAPIFFAMSGGNEFFGSWRLFLAWKTLLRELLEDCKVKSGKESPRIKYDSTWGVVTSNRRLNRKESPSSSLMKVYVRNNIPLRLKFLAALSSSWSLAVGPSVCPLVGPSVGRSVTFVKKLPLEYQMVTETYLPTYSWDSSDSSESSDQWQ